MELTPGFKMTEIGPVPEDWDVKALGELYAFRNGLNKEKAYFGYGTPIVNYMDVFGKPHLCRADIRGRVSVNRQEHESFGVRSGDVFFTRTSETREEIGTASVMLGEVPNTVFSGFLLRGRPTSRRVDFTFSGYALRAPVIRAQIVSTSSYTTRALTTGRHLEAVQLSLPPLQEQQAIAEVLGDVDALLDAQDRQIAKARDVKHATMQALLSGSTRLPGFSEPWTEATLGDVSNFAYGKSQVTVAHNFGHIPVFASSGQIGLASSHSHQGPVVIIGRKGTIDRPQYVEDKCWVTDTAYAITTNAMSDLKFLFYRLCLIPWMSYNESSGLPSLSANTAQGIGLIMPALAEQEAIAAVLSDLDAEIDALVAVRDKTAALKTGLMQQLLTGRTRLPGFGPTA